MSADRIEPPEDLLQCPEAEVYKHDRRSRVWRVADKSAGAVAAATGGSVTTSGGGGGWVVKRFEHNLKRQRLARAVGQHPAQREVKWNQRLRTAELPVVAIAASGVDGTGRSWLATRHVGVSLYNWLRQSDPDDPATRRHRRALTRQLGAIVGRLLVNKVVHGDLKASNLLVDADGRLRMIDVGACRGGKGTPLLGQALPMLKTLLANLRDAASYHPKPDAGAVSRAERMRFFRALRATWPTPPDGLQYLLRHPELR
ncbi:MAG: lipopolysaccharide kinase InaA family protein [Planctomycetota bacterium]